MVIISIMIIMYDDGAPLKEKVEEGSRRNAKGVMKSSWKPGDDMQLKNIMLANGF